MLNLLIVRGERWSLEAWKNWWTSKQKGNVIGANPFSQSWGQDHNRCVYKHLPVSKRGLETTGAWTKLVKLGLGERNGFTIKPQVTMFLEIIGTAWETSKLHDYRPTHKNKCCNVFGACIPTEIEPQHHHWLCVQWNPSIPDTLRTVLSVRIKGGILILGAVLYTSLCSWVHV